MEQERTPEGETGRGEVMGVLAEAHSAPRKRTSEGRASRGWGDRSACSGPLLSTQERTPEGAGLAGGWGNGGDCIGPLLSAQEEEPHRKIE